MPAVRATDIFTSPEDVVNALAQEGGESGCGIGGKGY